MSEDNAAPIVGLIALLAAPIIGTLGGVFGQGPIDFGRTVYSGVTGDSTVLKRELLDYNRGLIEESITGSNTAQVEANLAKQIGYSLRKEEKMIDPQYASTSALWDAAEDNSNGNYERWVWPSLSK